MSTTPTNHKDVYICDKDLHFIYKTDSCPNILDHQPHIHEHYEIFCFLSGDGDFVVEGNHYPLTPGSIFIVRPTEFHHFQPSSPATYSRFILEFSRDLISSFDPTEQLLSPFHDRAVGQNNLYLPTQFTQQLPIDQLYYAAEGPSTRSLARLRALSCLFCILTNILHIFSLQCHTPRPLSEAERIVNYINNNLSGNLTINELSKKFFLTKQQIERCFKKYTDINIKEYITLKRIHLAKELLDNGEQAVQVSQKCGFNDYSTFYRAYKKVFGISPKSQLSQ